MSGVTYRYEQSYSFMKKGIKHTIRENVIDGNSIPFTNTDKFLPSFVANTFAVIFENNLLF